LSIALLLTSHRVLGAEPDSAPPVPAVTEPPSLPATEAPVPSLSPPPEPAPRRLGVSLGLRVGWGFPTGALTKSARMRSYYDDMVPVWFDAGYRPSELFYLGAYFQWAPVFVADEACPKNLSCSATDLRFGIDVHWHFKWIIGHGEWAGGFDPWVGLGTGYESSIIDLSTASGARSHETNHGFEYGNVQLGGDFVAGPWHVGAFGSVALAEYLWRGHTVPTGPEGFTIPDPAVHFWFIFGLRGQYDL